MRNAKVSLSKMLVKPLVSYFELFSNFFSVTADYTCIESALVSKSKMQDISQFSFTF